MFQMGQGEPDIKMMKLSAQGKLGTQRPITWAGLLLFIDSSPNTLNKVHRLKELREKLYNKYVH